MVDDGNIGRIGKVNHLSEESTARDFIRYANGLVRDSEEQKKRPYSGSKEASLGTNAKKQGSDLDTKPTGIEPT